MSFNWVDWVILAVLGVAIVVGFARGLITAVSGFLSLVLGFVVALVLFPFGTALLIDLVPNPNVASVISFLVLWAVAGGLVLLLLRVLAKVAKWTPILNTVNRLLGSLMLFFQAGLVLTLIQVLLTVYPIEALQVAVDESAIMNLLSGVVPILAGLFAP